MCTSTHQNIWTLLCELMKSSGCPYQSEGKHRTRASPPSKTCSINRTMQTHLFITSKIDSTHHLKEHWSQRVGITTIHSACANQQHYPHRAAKKQFTCCNHVNSAWRFLTKDDSVVMRAQCTHIGHMPRNYWKTNNCRQHMSEHNNCGSKLWPGSTNTRICSATLLLE